MRWRQRPTVTSINEPEPVDKGKGKDVVGRENNASSSKRRADEAPDLALRPLKKALASTLNSQTVRIGMLPGLENYESSNEGDDEASRVSKALASFEAMLEADEDENLDIDHHATN